MTKILFICHGNICRSPLCEFIMKDFVEKKGRAADFYIDSAGTSDEEQGNPVHRGSAEILDKLHIDYHQKRARQVTKEDYQKYDYLIAMEAYNIKNLMRIIGSDPEHKVSRLLDFTSTPGDIDDPWYTGDFYGVYEQIVRGCRGLYESIIKK